MVNIRRVVAAVSGGVDSAVAALLLKHRGYEVIGVFMENWDVIDETGVCSAAQDAEDARWVCRTLGIPFHHANFVKQYWNDVFCNLLKDYEQGFTPNPDILCNRQIKFNSFYKYACEKLGACAIATGHYARTSFGNYLEKIDEDIGVRLLKPIDLFKDQTFFLSQVPQIPLQRTIFPLGNLRKTEVKRIAYDCGMEYLVHKKESTGICFIGSRNFQNFISEYVADKPGFFRDIDTGQVVGKHSGIHHWTVGQRCRLGGHRKPYFIARKDVKTNEIYVAPGTEHPSLFTSMFLTSEPHWIHSVPQPLKGGEFWTCDFRFQHTKPLVKCVVMYMDEKQLLVILNLPLRAITPGQFAVFYDRDECVGSARIMELGPSLHSLGLDAPEDILTKTVVGLH